MPLPYFTLSRPCLLAGALAAGLFATHAEAQTPGGEKHLREPVTAKDAPNGSSLKASAYYHFALGHLYEELAGAYNNRTDYINTAIDNYRQAIKDDPQASFLVQDIAELYRLSGRIREAVEEAQGALKSNPDDLNARRVLAQIYTQGIGDAQSNHVDESMARRAIEQYKFIVAKEPKDTQSLAVLGRLDRVVGDSVGAEASFRKILEMEPDNEDAVTGLASVYADRNDPKQAAELLEKLTTKTPTARSLVALASEYEQMKQFGLAADTYAKAVELDPSRPELKGALAQDQAQAGRFDDAIKTFQDMAGGNPQDPVPYLGMAQIYRDQRKYDKAQDAVAKAKAIDPENLDVRLEEARLLDAEGKIGQAITVLKTVIDSANRRAGGTSPQARADLLESLGALYRSDQQYDHAVETFHQAATLNPAKANIESLQVIETYRAQKQYSKALAESDSALAKAPDDRPLLEARAEVLTDQGKSDEAIATLKKLLNGKNDREVYLAMADAYAKAKNYDQVNEALTAAGKLSTTKEDRANVAFTGGSLYERQKKYDLAEKYFRASLEIDPDNATVLNYLGYMLADQGVRLPEAQQFIDRAVHIEPNNYAYLDSLGWVYYHQNKLPEAEQQLRRSLEMSVGNDPTIHDHLGDVYSKEGKLKEAIEQWQASLNAAKSSSADLEPDEVGKVQRKLEGARVRLAKEQAPPPR